MDNNINAVRSYLLNLQKTICLAFEKEEENQKFIHEEWSYKNGGGGISCVLENGLVFEKAGVNFSHVLGNNLPPSATANRPELAGASFEAMGISSVVHPRNPLVPTAHANVRFFIARPEKSPPIWWFGGGFDLTPYYPFIEDCQHWHSTAQNLCLPFGREIYPKFKKWADDYFYLPHRKEARGIGGIFFDDLNEWPFAECFKFMQAVGHGYLDAYIPIINKRKKQAYTTKQREFQTYRRGRYVEFNLVYDRGTIFGLQSGGRTESILMSLPPVVNWRYNWQPDFASIEKKLYDEFLIAREWI